MNSDYHLWLFKTFNYNSASGLC